MESQGTSIPQERTACQENLQCSLNPRVSWVALIVVFTLCCPSPLLCLEQHSTWDRLWSAERGKRSFSSCFSFSFSWQTTFQDGGEEVEDGAVYNVTLKKVQIQQAANKGARWLGVSEPGTGEGAHGLRSSLQGAEFHRNCYNINF